MRKRCIQKEETKRREGESEREREAARLLWISPSSLPWRRDWSAKRIPCRLSRKRERERGGGSEGLLFPILSSFLIPRSGFLLPFFSWLQLWEHKAVPEMPLPEERERESAAVEASKIFRCRKFFRYQEEDHRQTIAPLRFYDPRNVILSSSTSFHLIIYCAAVICDERDTSIFTPGISVMKFCNFIQV